MNLIFIDQLGVQVYIVEKCRGVVGISVQKRYPLVQAHPFGFPFQVRFSVCPGIIREMPELE
jgi:hypothetical protein